MMKRYILLFSITSFLIAGILLSKNLIQPSGTRVGVYEVKSKLLEETVTCTGRIEAAESEEVYVRIPCVADKVFVKAGDQVNKGDVLFSVDVESTKEVIAAAGGVSPSMVADDQIDKDITAPMAGEIRSINVSTGSAVETNSPCAVISSSDALQVKVAINESKLRNILVGQSVTVSGTAFTKDGYKGVVSNISTSARQQYIGTSSETVVDAIITLSEKDDSLKPGLSAKSKIFIGSQPDGIVIPYEYVMQDDDNHEYVYLYDNGHAVKRIVKSGKELSEGFEIVSGLSPGDKVIQNPSDISRPSEKVHIASGGGDVNG